MVSCPRSSCTGPLKLNTIQKHPRVRKIRVRNSGAGNGCANFMDTWKMRSFCRKTYVHEIPRFRGGGILGLGGGGGSADFIFMGAGIFLNNYSHYYKHSMSIPVFALPPSHILLIDALSQQLSLRASAISHHVWTSIIGKPTHKPAACP